MSAYVDRDDHFKSVLARDVAGMVLGDYRGTGTYRCIFDHASDPELIVKVENGHQCFCNVREWDVWERVKETALAKWFAPVVAISSSGVVLVMKRCAEVPVQLLPEHVPAFFTDLKAENWGLYEGRPVCLDYGNHLLIEYGMTKRMRRARWEDHG